MNKPAKPSTDDGRFKRSQRSRQQILDAALQLIETGDIVPTAQQIADQAGIDIRTLFRHFSDMDSLFASLHGFYRASYESLFAQLDYSGSLEQRIDKAIKLRAKAYKTVQNVARCSQAQRWRSALMRRNYQDSQAGLKKDLHRWLPELDAMDINQQEAIEAFSSFEYWQRLREHQEVSNSQYIAIATRGLQALMGAAIN